MNTPETFNARPGTCQAIQWTGDNAEAIRAFTNRPTARWLGFDTNSDPPNGILWVAKADRWVDMKIGDWVLAEPDGDGHYPCAKAIFAERWESPRPKRMMIDHWPGAIPHEWCRDCDGFCTEVKP